MARPLLTSPERRSLCEAILRWLVAIEPLTATELVVLTNHSRTAIHSVLTSLCGRGDIEAVGVVAGSYFIEHRWRLTEHGRFHDPRSRLPGIPRCPHCRRACGITRGGRDDRSASAPLPRRGVR